MTIARTVATPYNDNCQFLRSDPKSKSSFVLSHRGQGEARGGLNFTSGILFENYLQEPADAAIPDTFQFLAKKIHVGPVQMVLADDVGCLFNFGAQLVSESAQRPIHPHLGCVFADADGGPKLAHGFLVEESEAFASGARRRDSERQ